MNAEARAPAARGAVAVAGLACAVGSALVIGEAQVNAIVAALLGALAAVAVWRLPGPGSLAVGATSAGGAMIVLGYHVFVPGRPPSQVEALIGIGVPSATRYFAWLVAGLAVLIGVVCWLLTRRRVADRTARLALTKATAIGAVVAVVLVGAAIPGGLALADGTKDRLASAGVDRTTTDAPPPATDNGVPAWQRKLWDVPGDKNRVREAVAVPGRGVVVGVENLDSTVVRVYDARNGVERWHYSVPAGGAFVDGRDGRVLLVTRLGAVALDLMSGEIVGTARLPELSADWLSWAALEGSGDITAIGRTAVIGGPDYKGRVRPLLAIDVVDLTATEVEPNPSSCKYAVPKGSADDFVLVRYGCQTPARLVMTGGRLTATLPLTVPPTAELKRAQAFDGGVLLNFRATGGAASMSLVLGMATDKPGPVLRLTDGDGFGLNAVVLPAAGRDPQRILVAHGTRTEVLATTGAKLAAPDLGLSGRGQMAAYGDQLLVDAGTSDVVVLDAHTLARIRGLGLGCDADAFSATGSVGVIACSDGSLTAYH